MSDNLSPEEKLLRLIRGNKNKNVAVDNKPAISSPDLTPAQNYAVYLPAAIKKYPSFLNTRNIILFSLLISFVYLLLSFIYPAVGMKVKPPVITQEKSNGLAAQVKDKIKPLDFYLNKVGSRQIFAGLASTAALPASGAGVDILKDINLVGIIFGDSPQAIVEDKQTQKTYYLNKGQSLGQTEIQIDDIQENKIIVNYKGQKFELYL